MIYTIWKWGEKYDCPASGLLRFKAACNQTMNLDYDALGDRDYDSCIYGVLKHNGDCDY